MIIRHTRFPAVNIFTDSITALILTPNTSTFLMMEILNTDYSADASFQTAKTKMQRQLGEWSRAYRFSFLFSKFSTKSVVREAAVIFTFYPFDHKFQFRIFLLTVRKGFFLCPCGSCLQLCGRSALYWTHRGILKRAFTGCISARGGSPSASSMAVMPRDHTSQRASYE